MPLPDARAPRRSTRFRCSPATPGAVVPRRRLLLGIPDAARAPTGAVFMRPVLRSCPPFLLTVSAAIPARHPPFSLDASLGAKPAYLRNPHPAYPEEARAAHEQGVVTLRVNVNASGHVTNVRVVQSSGFPILDERARGEQRKPACAVALLREPKRGLCEIASRHVLRTLLRRPWPRRVRAGGCGCGTRARSWRRARGSPAAPR